MPTTFAIGFRLHHESGHTLAQVFTTPAAALEFLKAVPLTAHQYEVVPSLPETQELRDAA